MLGYDLKYLCFHWRASGVSRLTSLLFSRQKIVIKHGMKHHDAMRNSIYT